MKEKLRKRRRQQKCNYEIALCSDRASAGLLAAARMIAVAAAQSTTYVDSKQVSVRKKETDQNKLAHP
jgi:hypothetical protein